MPSVSAAIARVLATPEPRAKVMATRALMRAWRAGELAWDFTTPMPTEPARPPLPELRSPGRMPQRRRGGSARTRLALWHALAHIEFVAIDLALDMAGRFGAEMGREFVSDFLNVAGDEAMHFALLSRKLRKLGSSYGALPAHGGLWEAAETTRHDVGARLAIVPMVLEARGLDVTPATLERLRTAGDAQGVRLLERILADEIRHVAIGTKHFVAWCKNQGKAPETCWQMLVRQYFKGSVKPPFNDSARRQAGLSRDFYAPLA